jgi:anti-sigma factor RsiW
MEQQGRELLHSMRAAEFHQRSHRLADGASAPPPAHPAGLPQPEFGGFPKPETTCGAWINSLLCTELPLSWN